MTCAGVTFADLAMVSRGQTGRAAKRETACQAVWHPQITTTVSMTISLLFRVLCCIWFASEVIVAVATRTRGGKGNVRDRGSMLILSIVLTMGITGCEWTVPFTAPFYGGAPWLVWLATCPVTGIVIRWTAILTFGQRVRRQCRIQEEQKLKQTGLYRFVRHPSYSGLLLILLAVGLHSRSWAGLLVLIVPTTAALIYRIHVEEAALSGAFGEQYADYSRPPGGWCQVCIDRQSVWCSKRGTRLLISTGRRNTN